MVNIQLIRRHQLFNAVEVRKTPFPLFRKNKFIKNYDNVHWSLF